LMVILNKFLCSPVVSW